MLLKTNILALVGGGPTPAFVTNSVVIWDDSKGKEAAEIQFSSEVENVLLKRDRIVCICGGFIYIYNFLNFEEIYKGPYNCEIPGIIAVNKYDKYSVLAFPHSTVGYVKVMSSHLSDIIINAHESSLANLALNFKGDLLATCSNKGTLIRIFETENGTLLQELRRGSDETHINSITFSLNNQFLCCCSEKETVHIFAVNLNEQSDEAKKAIDEEDMPKNQKSLLVFKQLGKNYSSEVSELGVELLSTESETGLQSGSFQHGKQFDRLLFK